MNKTKIIVPKGIRYISEWENFELPDETCIIDKQITGCGFTEFCLTSPFNVILVSPRKILLENKEEQHRGRVFYATTGLEKQVDFEKDLNASPKASSIKKEKESSEDELQLIRNKVVELKENIRIYHSEHILKNNCKFLVTYDSFRHVKEALGENILNYYIVVDEFQSIFTDSKFKSSTEIEFLDQINNMPRVTFVSATPMIDKYLDMLDEFKDLPYYEFDWEAEDPSRVLKPKLRIHSCSRSINPAANDVVQSYLKGEFESTIININGELKEVISQEAVLYVNSVKNICDIIRNNGLTLQNTNILCSRTSDNEEKIRKAFNLTKADLKKLDIESVIGKVPTKGELHKMFTLCTRTVYLGADFYSTNARTFIFSDANIDSLTVDITLDLPQILGRQRLDENPWKNRAELYYKTINEGNKLSQEELNTIIERKKQNTNDLLIAYNSTPPEVRHTLAKNYQKVAKSYNYKDDYVAVNEHNGKDLIPVFNNLMMVSDMRCYEIQQIDYSDRFRVFNNFGESIENNNTFIIILQEIENEYTIFEDKMKYIYSLSFDSGFMKQLLDNLSDPSFAKYYYTISKDRAGTLKYRRSNLEKEYKSIKSFSTNLEAIVREVRDKFKIGDKYTRSEAKDIFKTIYESNGYSKTPKANDIEQYFEIKSCQITNKTTGKRDHGFEIVRIKDAENNNIEQPRWEDSKIKEETLCQ